MRSSRGLKGFAPIGAWFLIAGCAIIHDAREAQARLAPKGEGAVARGATLDLRGSSLERLVGFALTNRPSVKAAQLAVREARLELKALDASAPLVSAVPWTAPELSLRAGRSESSAAGRRLKAHTDGQFAGALSLDVLLYDFGRYSAESAAARERVVAAELACVEAGYEVFADVADAYFTVFEKDALLEVARTNESVTADHLARAEASLEAGEGNRLDVYCARLDLATAREATVAATNAVRTAGAELMRALGVDALAGSREDVLPSGRVGLDRAARGFGTTRLTAPETYAVALTNAPSVLASRARLRAAGRTVDYAVADLMPTLSVSAQLSFTDPLWLWNWGVSAVQSVFQGFRRTTALERAVVAMEASAAEVDRLEQELSLSVSLAVAARDNAAEALRTAADSVRQAKENLDLVAERFEVGDASRVDFTDATAEYVKALGNRVSSFYNAQRAEARLFALTGREPAYREEVEKL